MLLIVSIALLLIFSTYSLVTIISFSNRVQRRKQLDSTMSRKLKIKMALSGIGLGLSISILFIRVEDIIPFVYMTLFWGTILSFGLVKTAIRTISILRDDSNNDNIK